MALNLDDYKPIRDGLSQNIKDDKKFKFDFRVDGKRYRQIYIVSGDLKSSKDKIRDATTALDNYRNQITNVGVIVDKDIKLNDYALKRFDLLPQSAWSKKIVQYYENYIRIKLGNKKVSIIKKSDIEAVNKALTDRGLKPRTIKAVKEVLSPIFKAAIDDGIRKDNPCQNITIKIPDQKKIVINATEKFTALYNTVIEMYKNNAKYRAFFLLALWGRRKNEILTLNWEHIDFNNNSYTIAAIHNKIRKNQSYSLPEDVKTALLEFREKRGPVFGFKKPDKQVIKIRNASGVSEWSLHYSRNILVSMLAEHGTEPIYLSGILGHSDIHTVQKYLSQNTMKASAEGSKMIGKILG